MSNVTIQEDFKLPSLGKVYKQEFDPIIKIRSMTVAEEMKRLTATDYPYKSMSEIIESCLETNIPVSVYDMCLGDYQYLLHKLRTVTYGPDYYLSTRCFNCGEAVELEINLDDLKVNEYDPSYNDLRMLTLPVTKDVVELKYQSPRDLDSIESKKRTLKKEFPDLKDDPTLMLNIESIINSVNGDYLGPIELREYVKKMPMADSNIILQTGNKINSKVGIDTIVKGVCSSCGNDIQTSFRFTPEFFRPRIR